MSCNVIKKNNNDSDWRFDFVNVELGKSNDQGYLKHNDIINLSIKNRKLNDRYEFLRGHDYQVTIGDKAFYEVICHDKAIGADDDV